MQRQLPAYVEATFRVCQRPWLRWWGHYISAVLVYEIMFHRPSQEHGYVLKDVRVVATHARTLTVDEIAVFKQSVVRYFVNPCLTGDWRLVVKTKQVGPDGRASQIDSLMTLNVTDDGDDDRTESPAADPTAHTPAKEPVPVSAGHAD